MFRRTLSAALALICLISLSPSAFADESTLLQTYDLISPLNSGYFAVRSDGLWGIADESGNLVLEPRLEQEPIFSDGRAVVSSAQYGAAKSDFFGQTSGPRGVIDEAGKVCIPFEYDSIDVSEGIARAQRDGEYFFLDLNGWRIAGPYAAAESFRSGYAAVAVQDGTDWLWGAIDASGAEVIPCEYADIRLGSGGPAAVRGPGEIRFGFIDMRGDEIIPPRYDDAAGFTDGFAPVGVGCWTSGGCVWGAIDEAGNEVLPCEYDSVTVHPGGVLEARKYDGAETQTRWFEVRDGKAAEMDEAPDVAEEAPSTELNLRPAKGRAGDGALFVERREGVWQLVDADGAAALDLEFRNEPVFEGGLAAVSIQTGRIVEDLSSGETPEVLWGLIDDAGRIRIPIEHDELKLSEGIALVRDGEEYAFMNPDGTLLSDKRYFRAEPFRDGYAQVGERIETAADESFPSDALWGVIDKSGAEVVPCKFDFLELGDGGTAVVADYELHADGGYASEYGYIGMDGEYLFPERFDTAQPFTGDYAVVGERVKSGNTLDSEPDTILLGVIGREGKQVLEMEYDEIEIQENGECRAVLDGEEQWYQLKDGAARKTM